MPRCPTPCPYCHSDQPPTPYTHLQTIEVIAPLAQPDLHFQAHQLRCAACHQVLHWGLSDPACPPGDLTPSLPGENVAGVPISSDPQAPPAGH